MLLLYISIPHKHIRKIKLYNHPCPHKKGPKSSSLVSYSLCNVLFVKDIADTMAHMQREGCLLRGEHNILGEAFLVMASTAG